MVKDIQSRNKKYAKMSANEAEAKQQIANHRERQRQSTLGEAFGVLDSLCGPKNSEKRSQLAILKNAISRIRELEGQLLVQGQPKNSGVSRVYTGSEPHVSHPIAGQIPADVSAMQQNIQPCSSNDQVSSWTSSCRYTPNAYLGGNSIAVSPGSHNIPYMSTNHQNRVPAVNNQGHLHGRLSSCMFQTDPSTSAATYAAPSYSTTQTNLFQPFGAPSSYPIPSLSNLVPSPSYNMSNPTYTSYFQKL